MTLQQMRYAIALAECGSFNKAAKKLFISQPSLSNAIKELEKEIHVTLFIRTAKGVELSPEGHEFLESAKLIIKNSDQLLNRFDPHRAIPPLHLGISTLHYGFVSRVFAELISNLPNNYDVVLYEGSCQQALQDVISNKSEIGILYINNSNSSYLTQEIRDNHLDFSPLYTAKNDIIVRKDHPLAGRNSVLPEDIIPYPFLTYQFEPDDSLIMLGEAIPFFKNRPQKMLRAQDRSTLNWLLRNTDGYSLGHGLTDDVFYKGIIHIPLDFESNILTVGWIHRKGQLLSDLGQQFITLLQQEVAHRLLR